MVHSYKGGSGKTLTALNLGKILASEYKKRVLIIEADFAMPVLAYGKIGSLNPDKYFNDYLALEEPDLSPYMYNVQDNLQVIFASPRYSTNDKVFSFDFDWFERKIQQIQIGINSLSLDLVIFDLSPGKSLFAINTLVLSNKILLLLRPDYYSRDGTIDLIKSYYSNMEFLKERDVIVIFNQIPKHDQVLSLLDQWRFLSEQSINTRTVFFNVYYEDITAFHMMQGELFLPEDDPFVSFIRELISQIF